MLPVRRRRRIHPAVVLARNEVGAPLAVEGRRMMLDAMFLAIGFGFLAAAVLYVVACDRL